jgi:high-affinity iron transporter
MMFINIARPERQLLGVRQPMLFKRVLFTAVCLATLGLSACAAVQTPSPEEEAEAAEHQEANPPVGVVATGFNSAAIILREGLEAVLVMAVITSYMKTTKRDPKFARMVYYGVGAAVILSIVLWVLSVTLLTVTEEHRVVLEGVTSLLAVCVLFYVTNWLFHKAYVVDWMTFIKQETGKALAAGSMYGLVMLGFTIVFREGFETVLFYQTLLFSAEPAPVFAGFLIGLVILAGLAFAVLKLSYRLPIRPFFTVTGLLLLILAFKFMGTGIHEFQEIGVFAETALAFIPNSAVLKQVFGIFPYAETIAGQLLLLAVLGMTFIISRWSWKRSGTIAEGA